MRYLPFALAAGLALTLGPDVLRARQDPATGRPTAGTATDMALVTSTGTINGTLLLPANGPARLPVVLIIAGSGPTDRNGNSAVLPGRNDTYKMLAEALAASGIASLRYDKRGIAGSPIAGFNEADLRFETLVADAAGWITKLRNDVRFSTITVIGHSEGSLLGMLAAREARADAFVSIAGVARRASDILRDQLRPQLSALPALAQASETILSSLEQGKTMATVPTELASLYRPSVQPYLISWFTYLPSEELARLTIPVLLLQGSTDIQVGVDEVKLLAAAKPAATLKIVDGMNHVMKTAPADRAANVATYSNPALPIVAAVPDAIVAFIRALRPQQHPTTERRSPRDLVRGDVDGCRIAIEYGRPSKRDRVVWGTLVPWDAWWMPGADESTTITTSAPLMLGKLSVPAGDYMLYALPGDQTFSIIVSSELGLFHTQYHPARDLGRVPMAMTKLNAPVEEMTYAVVATPGGGGALTLSWDDRAYSARLARAPR